MKKENILNFEKYQSFQTNLIRVGSKNDGGYLVPDDLKNINACFSPGVDLNVSFETDLALKKIHLFVGSIIYKFPVELFFDLKKKIREAKIFEKI